MTTKEEITARYQAIHDDITNQYYQLKKIDKVTFDQLHSQCWQDLDKELILSGFKEAPQPSRDIVAELDELKTRLAALEAAK